jgi:hypothetical protein
MKQNNQLKVVAEINIKKRPPTAQPQALLVFCSPGVWFSKHFFNLPRERLRLFACGSGKFQFQQRRG